MERDTIFDLYKKNNSISKETSRLIHLMNNCGFVACHGREYTLKEFVSEFCFNSWKGKGRSLTVDDFFKDIGLDGILLSIQIDNKNSYICFLELVSNLLMIACREISNDLQNHRLTDRGNELIKNTGDILAELNLKEYYDKDNSVGINRATLFPEIESVAEYLTSSKKVEWNHSQ